MAIDPKAELDSAKEDMNKAKASVMGLSSKAWIILGIMAAVILVAMIATGKF